MRLAGIPLPPLEPENRRRPRFQEIGQKAYQEDVKTCYFRIKEVF